MLTQDDSGERWLEGVDAPILFILPILLFMQILSDRADLPFTRSARIIMGSSVRAGFFWRDRSGTNGPAWLAAAGLMALRDG